MSVADGALLLLRRARIIASDDQFDTVPVEERKQVETFCTMLDGFPLARAVAGAYIEEIG